MGEGVVGDPVAGRRGALQGIPAAGVVELPSHHEEGCRGLKGIQDGHDGVRVLRDRAVVERQRDPPPRGFRRMG
ncbi:hypothetical protein D3C72_2401630 [compost metagenome]